jgi:hypothetical protein
MLVSILHDHLEQFIVAFDALVVHSFIVFCLLVEYLILPCIHLGSMLESHCVVRNLWAV